MTKNAVVTLTRGYTTNNEYAQLIKRNTHIFINYYKNLENKDATEILIFHEGNINKNQQLFIQSHTPDMPLLFKNINFTKDTSQRCSFCPPTKLSSIFSDGYKNMCKFWSIDFLKYLKDYDYVIRIDEDCFIDALCPNIIDNYKKNDIFYATPILNGPDSPGVVVGMSKFFSDYLIKNNIKPIRNKIFYPYTNITIIKITYFLNNPIVMNVLNKIDLSNCIFSNRWGDLPIWGYIISLFVNSENILVDKSISYIHGSHENKKIN